MFIKFEENIIGMKGFSKLWINGTASAKKDSLEKHIKGDLHLLLPTLRKKTKAWDRYLQYSSGFFFTNREKQKWLKR